jgi:hypothetical protein
MAARGPRGRREGWSGGGAAGSRSGGTGSGKGEEEDGRGRRRRRMDELETDHDTMRGHEGERNWTLVGSSRDGGTKVFGPAHTTQTFF